MQPEGKLGGHLSAADGLRYVVVNARALGYKCVQIMIAGENDYQPMDVTSEDVQEFKKMMFGLDLYVHLPYVINPCESVSSRRGFYARTYRMFCAQASELGAKGVVIHPGFKKTLTEEEAMQNAASFFDKYYQEEWNLDILIETDAGSKNGSAIGSLDFIKKMIARVDHDRHAICIDTTHLYARGLDLWKKSILDQVMERYKREIKLVHLNCPDLDVELGSHRDRHNIPFSQRPTWDHKSMIEKLLAAYPCILERRSLGVQEEDVKYINQLN